jgi:hypothetical protein
MKNMKQHNHGMRASEYLDKQLAQSTMLAFVLAMFFASLIIFGVMQVSNEPLELTSVYQGVTK